MGKHANVAIFVPHAGCPHQCSFCNQRAISGAQTMPTTGDVRLACERAVETMTTGASQSEIAFFGGSFTAIDRGVMCSLLDAAEPFVKAGKFKGIRLSTRPDAVDGEVLELLKNYGVTAVELGAQSMSDEVLMANGRGHTAADVARACEAIHAAGLELGLQMMTGLYRSSDKIDRETARKLADLHPATIRIYPTIVMENTALAGLYRSGDYIPPTLEEAVALCAELLAFFERERGIRVIRLGLHAGQELEKGMLAGPWHPAFREQCVSEILYREALRQLRETLPRGGTAALAVNPREISPMIGQKRRNVDLLLAEGYAVTVSPDPNVPQGTVEIR